MANKLLFTFIAVLFLAGAGLAQTASFTFQGKLNDGGIPATGTYQFEFKLFGANGVQIGQTLSDVTATVTNGIFTVNLDFGAESFDGSSRSLEIGVRQSGGQNYTLLNPRQPISSTPYAIKSLKADSATIANVANDATRLGGIPAADYTQNTDPRLSDARAPTPNSTYYIQNGTSQQAASNFNVSGEGKANVFSATTQFNIGFTRILSATGDFNIFVGMNAGAANSTGSSNSFVGAFAGEKNTTGVFNSFFGRNAGRENTEGGFNSFFGLNAGLNNTIGLRNSFFGAEAGFNTTAGGDNSFFGTSAGKANMTGSGNSFFGRLTGQANQTGMQNTIFGAVAGFNNQSGSRNVFVGYQAGLSNTIENDNTFIGYKANGAEGITNATAIGANAVVTQSNSMVLGTNAVTVQVPGNLTVANTFSANALNSATVYKINNNRVFHLTGTDNTAVGFESGNSFTTGSLNAFFGSYAGKGTTTGINNSFFGSYAGRGNTTGTNNSFFGANAGLSSNGSFNAFFGSGSGISNTGGSNNSYFGSGSGAANGSGDNNSFFGSNAGKSVADVSFNSFIGSFSGEKTTTGAGNTFVGAFAGRENQIGFNNTFIGYKSGQTPTTGNSNVAIGYNASFANGVSNSIAIGANVTVNQSNSTKIGGDTVSMNKLAVGDINSNGDNTARTLDVEYTISAGGDITSEADGIFSGDVTAAKFEATSFDPSTFKRVETVDLNVSETAFVGGLTIGTQIISPGDTPLCASNTVGGTFHVVKCSSSLRYKDNIRDFAGGLELVRKLRPVTFDWKKDGKADVGFIAEEVNAVEPLLSTFNKDGQIEGVKYAQLTTALVNAVKEQQTQIETQTAENQKLQEQIKQQQTQIDALKAFICQQNPNAAVCAAAEKK